MAEAVGLAASVIGIAGLAGKIVKTAYKVKSLLEEVSNVPEDLQRCLEQVQVLASVLATDISDDSPPGLRMALCVAVGQCQQAANDLGKLAEDLYTQIHTGGRTRRKVQAAKVVLRKDIFEAHEKRLSSAIQMLMIASQTYGLAQQRYIIELQRSQPNVIVTQILAQLPLKEAQPPIPELGQQTEHRRSDVVSYRQQDRRIQNTPWRRRFFPDMRLGFPNLTGSLEIEYKDEYGENENEQATSVTRFRVQLPRWLSTRTLDSVLQRSQAGWNYFLKASRHHSCESENTRLVFEAVSPSGDSLQKLQPLLADGRISIHDTFQLYGCADFTLFSLGMMERDWPLCAFLATYDVPLSRRVYLKQSWDENDDHLPDMQKVFSRYYEDPFCWEVPFFSYEGSVDWFHKLRCSVWPDRDFYDMSSTLSRIELAREFILSVRMYNRDWSLSPSKREPLIRYLLYRDEKPSLDGIAELVFGQDMAQFDPFNSDLEILEHLLIQLGTVASLQDDSDYNPWLGLLRDLLAYIINEALRIHSDPFPIHEFLYHISTHNYGFEFRFGFGPKASRFALWILKKQLHIISGLGTVNLCELGRYFKSKMLLEPEWKILLSAYGDDPEDWKFWVRETTDKFAGEFWEWADPKPMWIPGAWVDEI